MSAPESSSPFARYLAEVGRHLHTLEPERRAALLAELRTHLDDAAAAEGRSPDAPALQDELIARLGPAARVGRELAVANEPPLSNRARRTLYIGAFGALLIPLLITSALLLSDEHTSEFVIFCSPVVLLLVVLALRQLCRPVASRLNEAVAWVGVLGAAALPLSYFASLFLSPNVDRGLNLTFQLLALILIGLTGVWAMLASGLLLARNRLRHPGQPLRDPLLGPALLGPFWGVAWLVMVSGLAPALLSVPFWLANVAVVSWFSLHLAWCLWMAVALVLIARTPQHRPRARA